MASLATVSLLWVTDSARLQAEETEVKTFWNIRFSDSPTLQLDNAGLADFYVPVHPDDEVNLEHPSGAEPQSGEALPGDLAAIGKPAQTIPLYVRGHRRPAVVVVHGGGWLVGDKWTLSSYSQQLAECGFCVLNINYRLAPTYKFPSQVDDLREALLFLVDHADRFSIDPNRIGLFGYSAGGHLSALVGVMTDETSEVQATSSNWALDDPRWSRLPQIAAVCAGGPPCDLRELPIDSEALSFFLSGTRRQFPERYIAASPTAHASAGDPPTHLIHGEKDLIVPIQSSEKFADALQNVGVTVALTVVKNQGHLVTLMHPTTQQAVRDFFTSRLLDGSDRSAEKP